MQSAPPGPALGVRLLGPAPRKPPGFGRARRVRPAPASRTVACDVLVVGSAVGRLAAAATAAVHGLQATVAEKAPQVGGTTALSGGFLRVPNNLVSRRDGVVDGVEAERSYLGHEAGSHFNAESVDAFLAHRPQAVEFIETRTALQFHADSAFSGCHHTAPGGTRPGWRGRRWAARRGVRPPAPRRSRSPARGTFRPAAATQADPRAFSPRRGARRRGSPRPTARSRAARTWRSPAARRRGCRRPARPCAGAPRDRPGPPPPRPASAG
jgi:FAD binding domain